MLVKKGDFLRRKHKLYSVVCADDECFVIGRAKYYADENRCTINYKKLEAYSNDNKINTLKDLNFKKIHLGGFN